MVPATSAIGFSWARAPGIPNKQSAAINNNLNLFILLDLKLSPYVEVQSAHRSGHSSAIVHVLKFQPSAQHDPPAARLSIGWHRSVGDHAESAGRTAKIRQRRIGEGNVVEQIEEV